MDCGYLDALHYWLTCCWFFQADQLKDAALHQDDSDLEKKRRETEALLQSMGLNSEAPVGMFCFTYYYLLFYLYRLYLFFSCNISFTINLLNLDRVASTQHFHISRFINLPPYTTLQSLYSNTFVYLLHIYLRIIILGQSIFFQHSCLSFLGFRLSHSYWVNIILFHVSVANLTLCIQIINCQKVGYNCNSNSPNLSQADHGYDY